MLNRYPERWGNRISRRQELSLSRSERVDFSTMLKSFAAIAGELALVLLLSFPAFGQEPCSIDFPHDANPTQVNDEDICNFHQVDADLYRGGRPRPRAYPKLAELGIRTIINLEEPEYAEREKSALDELNATLKPEQRIGFISFPIAQTEIAGTGVPHERLQDLFQQIKDAKKPIFLHCYHGKDRTGAIVAIYRMRRHQKSFDEAYEEADHYRFSRSDLGLRRTIDRYESAKKLQSLPRP
jgi:tyrosine-protein phosphatase SIW14